MNQSQLQENRLSVLLNFAGCFYAAKEMFGQPVKTLMVAVEGDSQLSNARVVQFTSIIDPPHDVVAYLSRRTSASVPVINVVTSCFENKTDVSSLYDKKVWIWIDGVWPRLDRDVFDKFLGMVVERPECATLRAVTKTEQEKYQISASRAFDVPDARFRRLNPLNLVHFKILEGRGGLGVEVACCVKAANISERGKKGVTYAVSEVEVTEPGFRSRGYKFAYALVAQGIFGIKYRSLHPAQGNRFGRAPEFIRAATPLPLAEAVSIKAAI